MDLLGEFRALTPKQLMEIAGKTAAAEQSIETQLTGNEVKKERLQTKIKENVEALKTVGVKVAMATDPVIAPTPTPITGLDPTLDETKPEYWLELNKKARVCSKMSDTGIEITKLERKAIGNKSIVTIEGIFAGEAFTNEGPLNKRTYDNAYPYIMGNTVFTDIPKYHPHCESINAIFRLLRQVLTSTDAFPLKIQFSDTTEVILNLNNIKGLKDDTAVIWPSSGFGLQSAKTGSFIVGPQGEFGDVIIDKDRLTIEKKLWAVNGDGEVVVDNETVSNGLQRLFISKLFPAKLIKPADIERFKELLTLFKYVPSGATKKTVKYKKVFAETTDASKDASMDISRNILAIVAGNTSKILINQTFKELDRQLKDGKISVDVYNDYIKQMASAGR